ncbi:pentapeptide repeat-containing protein [Fructilactobacillus sp. Tb1]|uniref:pentapeptide repeat-containing protein n=1 Tax=Fructilactobacillus sp. Tb1 TaxID=3422304 RepID=UPI003D2CAA4C
MNNYLEFDEIISGETYNDYRFKPSNKRINVSEVTFNNCKFEQTNFDNSEWLDCEFNNIDFANCNFNQSIIYRSKFKGCRLLGIQFDESTFKDVSFMDCDCTYLSLFAAKLTNVIFKKDNCDDSNFSSCNVAKSLQFVI